jgi:hypothetical protein
MKKFILYLPVLLLLYGTAVGGDLYKVSVRSADDAARLSATGSVPILVVREGYLVLTDSSSSGKLGASGLEIELIAADVEQNQLAVDGRLDRANVGKYPLLYEEDNLRLFQVDFEALSALPQPPQLFPIGPVRPSIAYREKPSLTRMLQKRQIQAIDLDSLISLVSQDSIQSYSQRLEAFYRRAAGTDSNYASRDWIAAKLTSFGYDSVVIDSFVADLSGVPSECQNVIAYKVGTRYPGQHLIIGAHRDAVPGSPGGDDDGSGTVGVLEMARVLKNIETDLTIVFIFFDAEEYGLLGSWHYVTEANSRGDSIVFMLNLDMIGHYENSNQAKLYYGADATYAQLWQTLADSLVGLTGFLSGSSSGSDHFPFAQSGYDVVFAHEYIFSTVYHSNQDSTTYLNYTYLTKMVQASLATAYVVNATVWPQPQLVFDYPGGVPKMLSPGAPTTFEVVVSGAWDDSPEPGTGQLHYSIDGGSFVTVPMTEITANYYEATLPAAECYALFSFYVSAQDIAGVIFYDPDTTEPFNSIVATGSSVVFADDFETDKGWTVYGNAVDGQWDRGVPVGGGDRGDPPTDFDGSGQCYLTDNVDGNSDVDDGTTYLKSPIFDLSAATEAEIHYARWYSNNVGNDPFNDVMKIYISNDNGATWVTVETVGPVEHASGGWYEHSFWVSDFVTPTAQMRMLFEASDLGAGSVVEAAVDDFSVNVYECAGYLFYVSTDSLPDWTVNQSYSQQLEVVGGTGVLTWTDKNNDLSGTGLALSTSGLLSGIPTDTGTIAFVALVTDELDSTAEKSFSFTINPAVVITTTSLPGGVTGTPYSVQLQAIGGTGNLTWTDKNNDLNGTGLSLASDGTLSGTPTDTGTISFTAQVVDITGSSDEKPLSLVIELPYICGDVDGDGSGPNVADLTYLVDYLFRNGPAPPVTAAANVDGAGDVNIADLTTLVDYLFRTGSLNCQ